MQNLPMEFRKHLVADDDNLMYNIDLSQAENRVVAYISPEPAMIAAFERGVDLHKQTASLIFGIPISEVSDEIGSSSIGGGNFSQRFWGKKANHGLNYDLGYKTFAFYYEIPEVESRFIVDKYHKAYPGVHQYHAWIRNRLSKDRTLENLFGRKRLFLDRWGDELFKSAYSYIPQSTVAEKINRHGLIYIYYNQHLFKPVDILLQVHDNIIFQMNYKQWSWEQQAECLILIKDSLESPLSWRGNSFSIPISLEIGTNLNKKSMVEVSRDDFESVERLAGRLSAIHSKFRTSLYL
jgi:DNA polymerase-1